MAKDPARVAAGKRAWAALSPAKKAAVRARLKRVRPKTTGGRSKAKPKAKGNPGRAVAKNPTSNPPAVRKPPKIGSAYTAAKESVMLLAPVTDTIVDGIASGKPRVEILRETGAKILSIPYAYNLAVIAFDAAVDRKTAQATALTMGSLTAWAPEIFLATLAFDEVQAQGGLNSFAAARTLHQRIVSAHQGYDPAFNQIRIDNPEFVAYRTIKHVGQAVRRGRSRVGIFRRVTAPLTKMLKVFGLRT